MCKLLLWVLFAFPCFCAQVYDCFLFFNELDLLEIRLNELKDQVDYFVLVEATETFKGKPKELFYEKNKERFKQFADKIIHVVASLPQERGNLSPGQFYYKREIAQRNQIMRGLMHCKDKDIVLISDVDEIPRSSAIAVLIKKLQSGESREVALSMQLYRYFFDRRDLAGWTAAIGTTYERLKMTTPHELRDRGFQLGHRNEAEHIAPNAGWHFSYMGGVEAVKKKIEAFSHSEGEHPDFATSAKEIEANIQRSTRQVTVDETYPRYIIANLERYKRFIYKSS